MWKSVQVHVKVYLSVVMVMFGHYPLGSQNKQADKGKARDALSQGSWIEVSYSYH